MTRTTVLKIIALVTIVVVYITIRLPIFEQPFGVELHGDKYATHVPTIINMFTSRNPFLYQNANYVSVLDNRETPRFDRFDDWPIVEWMILPFMPFSDQFSNEFVVRGIQTFYGVILLLSLYSIIKNYTNTPVALTTTLLFAINPVFQLVTLITNRDLPALLFLTSAIMAWQRKNPNLAYLLLGFSSLAKYSFFLINIPLFIALIFDDVRPRTTNILKLIFFSALPFILFQIFIASTPSQPVPIAYLNLGIFIGVVYFAYGLIQRHDRSIQAFVARLSIAQRLVLSGTLIIGSIGLLKNEIVRFSSNFLSDVYLAFDWPTYMEIFRQNSDLIGIPLMYISLITVTPLVLTWLSNEQKKFALLAGMIFGSSAYLVIALKSVFIHYYYRHIFVILAMFALSILIDIWYRKMRDQIGLILILATTLSFIIPWQLKNIPSPISNNLVHPAIREVGQFLNEHVMPGEKIIGDEILTLYTSATVINPTDLSETERQTINTAAAIDGYRSVFKKYKIKYFVTRNGDAPNILDAFTNNPLARTDKILNRSQINQSGSASSVKSFDLEPELVKKYIGWYVYELK